ncbi:MAG: diphosphomevalonate decarboxylase [Acidobacteriota bacterium]|nr:diphosphomevalonate decarboxylase [Acidobacteriota bacterium]
MNSALEPAHEPGPVTAEAPSNIAFIKYWGARDLEGPVPFNRSLSMTLDACRSICSASPLADGRDDEIVWLEEPGPGRSDGATNAPPAFVERTRRHLDRLREWSRQTAAPYTGGFRIATGNTFPAAAGIASSASGFTALTLAVTAAMGFDLPPRTLSALSRSSGSGSAARSAYGGYVEWPDGDDNSAVQILDEDAWRLCDVVAVVETGAKKVSSRDGHQLATSSPYFAPRLAALEERLERVRDALRQRDFEALGPAIEEEGIDLHLIAMSSRPPVYYWTPGTIEVLAAVRDLRVDGVAAYATMDAGANVHVICQPADESRVAERLTALGGVERVLRDRTGGPPVWRRGAGP